MYLHIPEISPTCGRNSDGIPIGAILQTQLTAARLGVLQATEAWSYRYEQNGGSNHISIPVMTDGGSFFPWNAAASSYLTAAGLDQSTPWAWAVNDTIDGQFTVPIV